MRPDPATHRCDVVHVDYSLVDHGHLRCAVEAGGCGRTWTFVERRGWMPSPPPLDAPSYGRRPAAPTPSTEGAGPW